MEFADSYSRDEILMRGPMLASYRDIKNKPTAGIRLDVPVHLMGTFKTLEAFGYGLKRRHGPEFRKHIKFDEFYETLYLQVGIKEPDTTIEWTTYYAQEAKEGLRRLEAKKGPPFDFLASPPMEQAGKKRPRPTDGNPAATGTPARESTSSTSSGTQGSGIPWNPPPNMKEREQLWRPPARKSASSDDMQ